MISSFFGKYRFLSNFYPCEVELGGLKFPTVEHAYQAAKCKDVANYKKFLHIPSDKPGAAKRLGRKIAVMEGWDDVKVEVMRALLRQKFVKEPFRTWLLNTGEEVLLEGNTWGDTFWGMCNGKGENNLGKLLMEIRDYGQ